MAASKTHDFHILDPDPWPLIGSMSALALTGGGVMWMHDNRFGPIVTLLGLLGVLTTMAMWWGNTIREAHQGHHTPVVQLHPRYGMFLFIASEVMFFVAWFWAYFNFAIFAKDASIGAWPPAGIVTLDPWHFPLLNTLILLTSGTTVTWAHHALQTGDRKGAIQGLILTVLLGASFTGVQAYEYSHAPFTFGFNNLALQPFTD